MLVNCGVEKTRESPLNCKEIQPVHPKGDQSRIFIGRTDAEVETPIPWPPDAKNWLLGKDPDAREDWRQEDKGTIEDVMVGWHHWLNGHGFEQALGEWRVRSLACCSPWGHKESDATELNWENICMVLSTEPRTRGEVITLGQWACSGAKLWYSWEPHSDTHQLSFSG